MSPTLNPIEPKSSRWEPSADPNDIVVPGLDTTAPVYDQIEQIEQLITIKLQNIDANFSKIQQIMANRILPAVKKYAVGTEPVREAAKFWTMFYEQAAQIRVPTYDDYSALQEQQNEQSEGDSRRDTTSTESETETTPTRSKIFNPDSTSSEVSFMPGQAAVSSTPATNTRQRVQYSHDNFSHDSTPSWSASLESPIVRLDREIQSLARDDEISFASFSMAHDPSRHDESQEETQRQIPHPISSDLSQRPLDKGKGKMPSQPLLKDLLHRNASAAHVSPAPRGAFVSPLKLKPKTPILKKLNPYLPPHTDPADWRGVVDLSDPRISSPAKGQPASPAKYRFTSQPSAAKGSTTPRRNEDDSFDESFGMSPPITMDFARLPKLGKTPKQEAAARIMRNLLDVERRGVFSGGSGVAPNQGGRNDARTGGTESSMSSVPSPPSLSRYTRQQLGTASETSTSMVDASLESMMRRVGLDLPGFDPKHTVVGAARDSTTSSTMSSLPSAPPLRTFEPPPIAQPVAESFETPEPPQFNVFHLRDDELQPRALAEDDPDSSLDSLEYEDEHNSANPSAAFLLASQRASYDEDNSFGSSDQSSDSLSGDEGGADQPVHPFARGLASGDADGFEDDDSFDDPEDDSVQEETLFGVPPAQRLLIQAQSQGSGQQLRMLGEDRLQDTLGIGDQMARAGLIEESPTPWGQGARGP